MEDLEAQAALMAWDWEANDIDVDEDDGKQWVLVTPQTMRHIDTARPTQLESPVPAMTPSHQMRVYTMQLSQDGPAKQASMPNILLVLTPQVCGEMVIKENLGKGSSEGMRR